MESFFIPHLNYLLLVFLCFFFIHLYYLIVREVGLEPTQHPRETVERYRPYMSGEALGNIQRATSYVAVCFLITTTLGILIYVFVHFFISSIVENINLILLTILCNQLLYQSNPYKDSLFHVHQ